MSGRERSDEPGWVGGGVCRRVRSGWGKGRSDEAAGVGGWGGRLGLSSGAVGVGERRSDEAARGRRSVSSGAVGVLEGPGPAKNRL
jgi:hypothetical protein